MSLYFIECYIFLFGGFFASTIYLSLTIPFLCSVSSLSVNYRIFPVPLAWVIIPFIPYIHSSVYFHFFVLLAMKPLYNFLDVFNFFLGVNLFHFIDFSIFLNFFSFQVVTMTFIYTFFHALC